MSAEYIAIGCSAAMMFITSGHPKYTLSTPGDSSSTSSPPARDWQSPSIVALQISMEVISDFIACTVEMKRGVDFQPLRKYKAFVIALLACVSVINVQITAMIYIKHDATE